MILFGAEVKSHALREVVVDFWTMNNNETRVWIRDPQATRHHFPFSIGDTVTIVATGESATVENAYWEGDSTGAHETRYILVKKDGELSEVEVSQLQGSGDSHL